MNNDLTKRHIEILILLSQGYERKTIGNKLGISDFTVRSHLVTIYNKLNAHNAPHAIAIAKDRRLI